MTAIDLVPQMREYLARIHAGDPAAAVTVVLDCLRDGVSGEAVIEGLLAPAQAEIGRGWQEARWSIALEHRASAITESALETVVLRSSMATEEAPRDNAKRATVLCAEGEWHTLPARMATAVMRMRGLNVTFVGPSLPAEEIVGFLGGDSPPVVAVSCSLSFNLVGAWRTITAIRQVGAHVLAGGRGFGTHGAWAGTVGADDWASNFATGADKVIDHPADLVTLPRPGAGDPVAVMEVLHLRRHLAPLAEAIMREALGPNAIDALPDHVTLATRRDVQASLGAVASAVLVGDPWVVESHVEWLEQVVAARELPLTLVSSTFQAIVDQMSDQAPLARFMAEAGYRACTQLLD